MTNGSGSAPNACAVLQAMGKARSGGVQRGLRSVLYQPSGRKRAPVLAGFSPMMQFIHIDDMADAIVLAYKKPTRGVYNVAPQDWVAYQHALKLCGCKRIQVPSIPPMVPKMILGTLKLKSFPSYLMAFFKYPVVIDGRAFVNEFGFEPKRPLQEIFRFYRENKRPV